MSKKKEVSGPRLQQRNLLQQGTKIFIFRSHHDGLSVFFKQERNACFCTDVNVLMQNLRHMHVADEWRFFID